MLYGKENQLDLKLLIGLSRATQKVHRRSAGIFKEAGLTIAQFAVIEALYSKGVMTINEIIATVLSTSGNMTVVIKNLEKEQLLIRYINPKDKRSSLIGITEKGRSKVEEIFPSHLKDLEKCFSVYTEEEKEELIKLLRRLKT